MTIKVFRKMPAQPGSLGALGYVTTGGAISKAAPAAPTLSQIREKPNFNAHRILVVGKNPTGEVTPSNPTPGAPGVDQGFLRLGLQPDFETIGEAMAAIPLVQLVGRNAQTDVHPTDFKHRWTILVTPGHYIETIEMKPFVTIIGVDKDAVFIEPSDGRRGWRRLNVASSSSAKRELRRDVAVSMNHFTNLSNVTLIKSPDSSPSLYMIVNRDGYGVRGPDVEGKERQSPGNIGVYNVAFQPLEPYDKSAKSCLAKSIRLEGDFGTIFFTLVGGSYHHSEGYDIEIVGESGQIADVGFFFCSFDAVYANKPDSGVMMVKNCKNVAIRNSMLRVGDVQNAPPTTVSLGPDAKGALIHGPETWGSQINGYPGAALAVKRGDLNKETGQPQDTGVIVVNSHLSAEGVDIHRSDRQRSPGDRQLSYRVLDVEDGAHCDFFNSTTDSVRGRTNVYTARLPDDDTVPDH